MRETLRRAWAALPVWYKTVFFGAFGVIGTFADQLPNWLRAGLVIASFVAITLVLLQSALFLHRRRAEILAPEAKAPVLNYEHIDGYIHHREDWKTGAPCDSFRPRITLPKGGRAKDATPYMLLYQEQPDGSWRNIGGNKILLFWPGSSMEEHIKPRTFSDYEHILLLDYNRQTKKLSFYNNSAYTEYHRIRDDIPPGRYKIDIQVAGEFKSEGGEANSVGATFLLEWSGNIDDFRLIELRQPNLLRANRLEALKETRS
jgi:hypothetical protein